MRFKQRILVGLLSGLAAALTMTLVMLALRWVFGVPTPSEMFGDRMVPTYSAGEFLGLLERLGGYNRAKQLGVTSVLGGQLAVGIISGAIYSMLRSASVSRNGRTSSSRAFAGSAFLVTLVIAFWIASILFLEPVLNVSFAGLPPSRAKVATEIGLAVSYITYAGTLALMYRWMSGRIETTGSVTKPGRRIVVAAGMAAGLGAILVFALQRFYRVATFSYDGTQYIGPEVEPITPNNRFYTVTKNIVDPAVDRSFWRFQVAGLVDHPRMYNYEALSQFETVTQEATLMCISNWVGGGLMSNAVWEGLRLRDLLLASGPREGVVEVMFRSVDGYADTISFDRAMEPTTLVAFRMNGEPLPRTHGYPARIIVPGMFGEKNVKWVTRVELVDYDAKGFYEQQGWGPNFSVPTRSRFDFPYYDQTIKFTRVVELKGIAFGGDRGVSKVEVSVDGGKEWRPARVDYPGTRLSWALWSVDWNPPAPGVYSLVVRSTDGKGELQSAVDRGTVPEGATGLHRVKLTIET
ncbi:MAG TPA: molybdopterin-dependent oxidoreductase [Blastocatellia bacterium]|nr:molybdopterin-dependent oxidoreductase [Blastocatellia bacterium]